MAFDCTVVTWSSFTTLGGGLRAHRVRACYHLTSRANPPGRRPRLISTGGAPHETDQGSAHRTLSRPAHAHRPERQRGSQGDGAARRVPLLRRGHRAGAGGRHRGIPHAPPRGAPRDGGGDDGRGGGPGARGGGHALARLQGVGAGGDGLRGGGADGVMLVTPYYYVTPTQEGIREYFRAFAQEVPVPVMLYEIPYRTGVAMKAETIAQMADDGSIIGMKVCNADFSQFAR